MHKVISSVAIAALMFAGSVVPAFAASGSGGGTTSGGGGGGSTATTTTSGGGGGGGGVKVICNPFESYSVTAEYLPGSMSISAGYYQAACVSGKTVSTFKITNVSTGATEYLLSNTSATSTLWARPAFDTDYKVEISVLGVKGSNLGSLQLLGTQSVTVHTPVAVPNCAVVSVNELTTGYWLTYAAIWTHYGISDCGYGRETALMRITNLDTGVVTATYALPIGTGLVDYEGPVVGYNTNYQIDVEVHGAQNELLDSKSSTILTPPMR